MNINWRELRDELGDIVTETLEGLAEGAKEDLQVVAKAIANDMLVAVRMGRRDLLDDLIDQGRILAEIHRIRMADAAYDALARIADLAFRVGRAALAGV